MSQVLLIDSGPLGRLCNPNAVQKTPELQEWFLRVCNSRAQLVFSEVVDFEIRRNLLLHDSTKSLLKLDEIVFFGKYLPISTPAMRLAARIWADLRRAGRSVGDPKELNADVIIAAQAILVDATLVTENPRHFPKQLRVARWEDIKPH